MYYRVRKKIYTVNQIFTVLVGFRIIWKAKSHFIRLAEKEAYPFHA